MHEIQTTGVPIKLWTPPDQVEEQALKQLNNVATLPWAFHHVAVMADVHYGKGCTVGSVVAMKDAIAPAAVGVDIGCGMIAARTNLMADDVVNRLSRIRSEIEKTIPVGFNMHESPIFTNHSNEHYHMCNMPYTTPGRDKAAKQLGTLGGGNHFIELCIDTQNRVWIMLHSGSRNVGKELAEFHITNARSLAHNVDLPDPDLAVFLAKTQEMKDYVADLLWAQAYARINREIMLDLCRQVLTKFFDNVSIIDRVGCHHNYVSQETHFGEEVLVTRKGAINAEKGTRGIIPGSMGTKSYIVTGLGNPESFNSASHGAGRRMSRGAAKRMYTELDLIEQTKGIECRKDVGVLDEIPSAYKDIEQVMANQSDLVRIDEELKQILCVKG